MLPYKNKHPLRSVGIPSLSGGVNLRDGLTQVNDNQLTDVKNMWFKDGMLKTRPGVVFDGGIGYKNNKLVEKRINTDDVTVFEKGVEYRLLALNCYQPEGDDYSPYIRFFWVSKTEVKNGGTISGIGRFVIQQGQNIYCFTHNKKIYKGSLKSEEWQELDDKDIYAPLIATNYFCRVTDNTPNLAVSKLFEGSTMVEGFNLLGYKFRLLASTVPPKGHTQYMDDVYDSNGWHNIEYEMNYRIPYAGAEGAWEKIVEVMKVSITPPTGTPIVITLENCEICHDEYYGTYYKSQVVKGYWNLQMLVYRELDKQNIRLIFLNILDFDGVTTVTNAKLTNSDYIANNMEIIAPCVNTTENINKVFNMTCAEWFGGASAGLNGGTRLFLGGNVDENEQSLVIWSDLNNPLYFPENNYAYVGNANIPVTGFGKQNDMLVIFKSSEIFATQYVQNSGITAESLINQSVVDIAANLVYFPLIQIHSSVGCDLPDTIQLCRNRLVWATKQGKVYTLVSQSQYNERNVFEISQMIERKLKGALNEYAHAVDYDGYYMLFCGNKAFVCDYNSYGYIYTASHSKTEDANIRIPWYYWEFENKVHSVLIVGDKLYIVDYNEEKTDDEPPYITTVYFNLLDYEKSYDKNGHTTAEHPIKTSFTTKAFDFSAPQYEKHIPQVHIAFGDNGNEPINISFLTDKGEAEGETVYIPSDESSMRDSTYLKSTVIRPNVRFARHFGIKAECEGAMAVGDVSINYRIQGEVK